MSCRETSSGSALTSYARLLMGRRISEPATLSTFHYLRNLYLSRDPEQRRVYTQAEYDDFLQRSIDRVEHASGFTERQRESILARLRAAQSDAMPDQATVYALRNLTPTMRERDAALTSFIAGVAQETGQGISEVRERFNSLSSGVTRRNATDYTPEGRELAAGLGIPRDPGSVHAVQQLHSEVRHMQAARAARATQRIVRREVEDWRNRETTVPGLSVEQWGYDPRNGRLEVVTRDGYLGETTIHAYRGVPQEVADSIAHNPGGAWYTQVRGNPDYQYEDEIEAALDGAAPRCAACGQFANNQHACEAIAQPQPDQTGVSVRRMARYTGNSGRWTRQSVPIYYVDNQGAMREDTVSAYLPPIRRFQTEVRSGPVDVDIDYARITLPQVDNQGRMQGSMGNLSGRVRASLDEDGALVVDTSRVQCRCMTFRTEGTCPHIGVMAQMVRDRYERPNAATQEGRRRIAQAEALEEAATRIERMREAAAATDWMRDPATAQEAASTWIREAEIIYSEDSDGFRADIEEALERAAAKNGAPDIPFMTENALDGLCTRESGKGFGVEIEYEFPSSMSYPDRIAATERIGQQLYAAGLTYSPDMQPYRASQRRGVRDTHSDPDGVGNWSWERDGSVEGELVTPIMYDEPETWQKLDQALQILRDNGAVAGTRAGAHVHVGTADFNGSPAAYAELSRIVVQHEDVIARLASNPQRGTHRNNGYSRPTPNVPPTGFHDISDVRDWQRPVGRYALLNVENVRGGSSDHPEFRIFDSSLDPGTVQAQIKMSVAMTEAAKRNALLGGTGRDREPWGANYLKGETATRDTPQTVDQMVENSSTTRSFIDMLFRRRADKAQVASIFAHTRWTVSSHSAPIS